MERYKIVYQGGEGELTEKKSRFLSAVIPIASEEEALNYIETRRKKYWDARHHCYAYTLGERNEIMRFSDDGEPSGTAGKPILDVLMGEGIHNTLIIVTRYFGGTLLGCGGLVRAYSHAALSGLRNSKIVMKEPGSAYEIDTDYTGVGKLQHLAAQMELLTEDMEYTERVKMRFLVPEEVCEAFEKKVTEITNGKADIFETAKVYFGSLGEKVVVFERFEIEKRKK